MCWTKGLDLSLSDPLDSANAVVDAAVAASAAVEPTLKSLGLASTFPGGIVQAALENLHIGLDIPWWSAIVIGTSIFFKNCHYRYHMSLWFSRNSVHLSHLI